MVQAQIRLFAQSENTAIAAIVIFDILFAYVLFTAIPMRKPQAWEPWVLLVGCLLAVLLVQEIVR